MVASNFARRPHLRSHGARWARSLLLVAGLGSTVGACKRGNPPALLDVGTQVAVVGEQLLLQLVASDPDGDPLTYEFSAPQVPDLDTTASISQTPNGQGLFTFTPLASQIGMQVFEFIVSDGRFRTTLTVTIDVRGAVGVGSMPVFRSPLGSGTILDLDQVDCQELQVEVDDPDSASITLEQAPPVIENAVLDVDAEGRSGRWSWCPSRQQIETNDRYLLTLRADDGDNPPVTKDFAIVLRRRKGEDCPGKAPAIEHTPMDFTTSLDLPLEARIIDDIGLGSTPYVVYASEDPGDPIDFTKTTLVNMELVAGDMQDGTWRGRVPNVVANEPDGTTVPLYYLISATDNDDAEGDCDHRTDAPASGTHRVNVTRGGNDSAGLCEPCSFDVQCGGPSDLCLPSAQGAGACGQGCDGTCDEGYVCSPEPVQSVEGAAARQCIPNSGTCGGATGNCDDDDSEPNDDPLQALGQPELSPGMLAGRVLCPSDEDWYPLELTEPAEIFATLEGDNPPDLDLALTDDAGLLIDSSDSLSSSESVYSGCLEPGRYLLRVHSIDAEPAGTYSLELGTDPIICGQPVDGMGDCCVDNDSPGCEVPSVQECVCALDNFCCQFTWDVTCAGLAADSCEADCDAPVDPNEDCCTEQNSPGCTDMAIQDCVCALDAFCCENRWDSTCVGRVGSDLCGPACIPDDDDGGCCINNGTPGCEINSVESCVCAADPLCCDAAVGWDDMCVTAIATNGCGTCPG